GEDPAVHGLAYRLGLGEVGGRLVGGLEGQHGGTDDPDAAGVRGPDQDLVSADDLPGGDDRSDLGAAVVVGLAVPDVVGAFLHDDGAYPRLVERVTLEPGDALLAEAGQLAEQEVAGDPGVGHPQGHAGGGQPPGEHVGVALAGTHGGVVAVG